MRAGRLRALGDSPAGPTSKVDLSLATEFDAGDWILDALLSSSIYLLTAHNSLVQVSFPQGEDVTGCNTHDKHVIHGPGSFLYSGNLVFARKDLIIVASGTVFGEILVWTCSRSREDQDWTTSLRHVFKGHQGSVFGVSVSTSFTLRGRQTRLLASCSDDRTVRLWDISDCETTTQVGQSDLTTTVTGFGESGQGYESQLASAWGHISRIWSVDFVSRAAEDDSEEVFLLSRGEDAACQLWSAEPSENNEPLPKRDLNLTAVSNDRYHAGKNAWSMAQLKNGPVVTVFTGGADGQIISRIFSTGNASIKPRVTLSRAFNDITSSPRPLRQYLPINHQHCFATTDVGDIYRVALEGGELTWSPIHQSPLKAGFVACNAEALGIVLLAQQGRGLFALSTARDSALMHVPLSLSSNITWMQVASPQPFGSSHPTICVVVALANREAMAIWLILEGDSGQAKQTILNLPNTFSIASTHYDHSNAILLLGSRAGAIAVYPTISMDSEVADEPICLRHVHGTDCVTSISALKVVSAVKELPGNTLNIVTTGRDGTYSIHRLNQSREEHDKQPILSTVHCSTPPFGPNIEGAYMAWTGARLSADSADLVLYGFHSTSFVVWNETQQSTILSVDCGGARRSWAYFDSSISTRLPTESSSSPGFQPKITKNIIWTKVGRFNWHTVEGPSHVVIQRGGHGREIKAITRRHVTNVECGGGQFQHTLIATGAEDTSIRLFSVSPTQGYSHQEQSHPSDGIRSNDPEANTSFQTVGVLKRHTSGIQHLRFSRSGEYLFSSAGVEEFCVWRLSSDVPCIGIGTVLWDMMPKEEADADARIMSFDLREHPSRHGEGNAALTGLERAKARAQSYTLALAYSNGKTKVLRYTPSYTRSQGVFETLQEISAGFFCVIQTSFLSFVSTLPPQTVDAKQKLYLLSAGTNGFLYLGAPDTNRAIGHTRSATSRPTQKHKVHQSSVLAMETVDLSPGLQLIVTGGDDNALGLTLLYSTWPGDRDDTTSARHRLRTMLVPRAHAAALTALKAANLTRTPTGCSVDVITAGNDQRINVWNVHIDVAKATSVDSQHTKVDSDSDSDRLLEAIKVQRAATAWTAVADVSGLEIVTCDDRNRSGSSVVLETIDELAGDASKDHEIVVVGVGMELLSMAWS